MAAEIISADRIELELKLGNAMLEELSDNFERWREMLEGEQVSWLLDWDQFIHILEHTLNKAYVSNQMTPAHKTRYKELLSKIKDATPTIQKLNLTEPNVSLTTL